MSDHRLDVRDGETHPLIPKQTKEQDEFDRRF